MKEAYEMVKQEFIKKWKKTLQEFDSCEKKPTNITETKNAIKLTSNIAIAAARGGSTLWSRTLISRTTAINKPMARRVLRKTQNQRKMKKLKKKKNGKLMALKKLKSLVPGGELIEDKDCLLKETFDYIVYLRAQVDAMRTVAVAVAGKTTVDIVV